MYRTLAIAACLTVSLSPVAAPEQAKAAIVGQKDKTRAEFLKLWSARLQTYATQRQQADAQTSAAAKALLSGPLQPSDKRLEQYVDAQITSGQVYGRGLVLNEFIKHIETKPSVGLTRAWLQGQFSEAQAAEARAQQTSGQVRVLGAAADTNVRDFYLAVEQFSLARGEAWGRAQELSLILDNFSAYADEFERADAKDREARARLRSALAAFGQGLQANRGWTSQCTVMGPTVSCSGQ